MHLAVRLADMAEIKERSLWLGAPRGVVASFIAVPTVLAPIIRLSFELHHQVFCFDLLNLFDWLLVGLAHRAWSNFVQRLQIANS